MISESTLKGMCTAAVFARGRLLADDEERFHRRRCRYTHGETVVDARVEATQSWDGSYRTSVVLDEEAGTMVDYGCDCPAAARFSGPCKHAMGLAILFGREPRLFEGYNDATHRSTSREVLALMERAEEASPLVSGTSTEASPASVRLELTLGYEVGFDARFRLEGMAGSYVLKSLQEFASDLEGQAFRSYGKRLAFTHTRSAFSPASAEVCDFIVRAVQNRRAYAFERVVGRGALTSQASSPQRELHLSPPELWELLGLYEGSRIRFEDRSPSSVAQEAQVLTVRREDPSLGLSLTPLEDGGCAIERPAGIRLVTSGGHAVAWDDETLYLCSDTLAERAGLLGGLLSAPAGPLVVSERDTGRFLASTLPRLEEATEVAVAPELERLRPAPCKLEFYLDRTRQGMSCTAYATYGEARIPLFGGRGAEAATAREAGPARPLVRDMRAEARGREAVRRIFPVSDGAATATVSATGEALAQVVYEGTAELQRLGSVFVTPSVRKLRTTATPRVSAGISVRSNLLDLTMAIDGLPTSELAPLLASYRLKRRYHKLADGSYLPLQNVDMGGAASALEELGISERQLRDGTATVEAYRALALDKTLSSVATDASLDDYLDRIRNLDLSSFEVPAPLAEVLRPYQADGFRWLMGLSALGLGGILADEMGLGKSVQLIAYVLASRGDAVQVGPSVVVCPASLVYNWQAEFEKFAPGLSVGVVAGTSGERDEVRASSAEVLITSYDLFRRDVDSWQRMHLWSMTLDEAQYIKNHTTQAARAVKAVAARHKFALTGTPVENRLSELWSIFDYLMPGLLGSYEEFRERFERPIVEDEDTAAGARLKAATRPFVLRRLKRDVVRDLPEKIEQVIYARMEGEQRLLYDSQVAELRDRLGQRSTDDFGKDKLSVLAALTHMRQTCCDPSLIFEGYAGGSAKTETILTLIDRAADAGEKVLVFSQFTSYLALVAQALSERGYTYFELTGSTPKRRRLELVDRFNADDTPVFLISLKAGGTGLNLTSASVVIHADPWWNVAAQNQATDRAHRIGQTRDVTVYKVIAKDSVEERILELQRTKAELANAVVEGDVSGLSLASLTPEDLEDLLR